MDFTYDEEKFRELVVYIAAKNDLSDKFGMTKLNKLLFFSDFTAYARLGRPITGASYIKMPFGPCPTTLRSVTDSLTVESRVFSQKLTLGPREGSRLVAVFDANLDVFSGPEISIIDEIIQRYWNYTGVEISNVSHGFIGWELAADRENIPYYSMLIPDRPRVPSAADMAEAHRRATTLFG